MFKFEYRGYGGKEPHVPESCIEQIYAEFLYKMTFDLFGKISSLYLEKRYAEYNGPNDLFKEDGKINREGQLTKHLYAYYKDVVEQCNFAHKHTESLYDVIQKFDILPDLSFAAVLSDGTVLCMVDKETE